MKHKLKTADFNLFLLPSDTEMTKFIGEVLNLGEIFPEIYLRIARPGQKGHGIIAPFYAAKMVGTGDSVHEVKSECFFSEKWMEKGRRCDEKFFL